jgi:hypothetical protein
MPWLELRDFRGLLDQSSEIATTTDSRQDFVTLITTTSELRRGPGYSAFVFLIFQLFS